MTLKEAIKYVKESCKEEGLIPDSNAVLDVACRIFISRNISESKRENIKAIQNQPGLNKKEVLVDRKVILASNPGNGLISDSCPRIDTSTKLTPSDFPTQKQINMLKKLGLDIPNTKKEAWAIINSIKKEQEVNY